jgi:hypothetical protein
MAAQPDNFPPNEYWIACQRMQLSIQSPPNLIRDTGRLVVPKKSAVLAVRVTPEFKETLRRAAAQERRSQSNLLEVLLYDYCKRTGLPMAKPDFPGRTRGVAKGAR